jgi:polyribonucleotide 5'-hydroxyl-kinase
VCGRSLSGQETFVLTNPLAYFYGHTSLSDNAELFRLQVQQLAAAIKRRMANDEQGIYSGVSMRLAWPVTF